MGPRLEVASMTSSRSVGLLKRDVGNKLIVFVGCYLEGRRVEKVSLNSGP